MNYLRLAIAILLAAFAQPTYADSVTTFHITQAIMDMGPNDGSGDNVGFTFTGPGITISGTAGMGCPGSLWCTGQPVPDESAFPSEIFISGFPDVTIGGAIVFADFADFFDSNGGLNPTVSGFLEGGIPVLLTLPTDGSWQFNFADTTDQFGNPAFSFTGGTWSASAPLPTPEPGTIGLMMTGLLGIGGLLKRTKTFRR